MKESTRKKKRVTAKMKEARVFVDSFWEENKYPPSYAQVQKHLKLESRNTAYHRLRGYRHRMVKSK